MSSVTVVYYMHMPVVS